MSSKAIAIEMGGDLKLFSSSKGLSVFKFKIPVKITENKLYSQKFLSNIESLSIENKYKNMILVYGENRKINESI